METYDYLDINWYTYVANFSRTAQKELFLKILPYVPMVFSIAFLILARRLLWNGYRKI